VRGLWGLGGGQDRLTTQTWNNVQRTVYLWFGPVGVLACAAALATQWHSMDPFDRVALPLLALELLLTTTALAVRVMSVAAATRVTFLCTTAYFLVGLNHQFWWFVPHYQMLSESTFWFAVLYATAFIAFRGERAIQVCAGIFAASLVICGVQLGLLGGRGQLTFRMVASCVQFLISSGVLVVAQYAVGKLRQQLDQVRAAAYLDALTGLPNRRAFVEALEGLLTPVLSGPGPVSARAAVTVLTLHCDFTPPGQDHHPEDAMSDEALLTFASRLQEAFLPLGRTYRLDAQVMAVLAPHLTEAQASDLVCRALQGTAAPGACIPRVSSGLACSPADASTPEELMRVSERRMDHQRLSRQLAHRTEP